MICCQENHAATQITGFGDLEVIVVGKLAKPVPEPLANGVLALKRPRGDAPSRSYDEQHVVGVHLHGSLEVALVRRGVLVQNDLDRARGHA